ncbi:MAG: S41 family peptidase [Rickettsiales bacterium]|nr:S41 family peptidase [Rickettsiales bacterium]
MTRTFPLFIVSLWLVVAAFNPAFAKDEAKSNTYEMLNLFGDVFERVRKDYVETVDDEKLVESAINGMLTSLDPHSGYLNRKSFKEMQVQTKGEFGGLGIEVTMENGLVKVVSPIDDTPAFRAGVQAGDFISQIDEEPVMGLTLSEAVEKMRGRVGTDIKITILREGLSEPLNVDITRDLIKIKSVRARAENDVAYIRVVSFSESTYDSMKRELEKQKKEIGTKLKGVVLDLRNNPGGLLDQAIAVSDAFLDRGEIVSTRERDPQNTKRYSARKGDLADGLPIVVLINQGSASASEIVAGALKDHQRAVILGTKSFGKGSVQTVIPLKEHGAMRLTTARYYTPSGVSIQAKGIEPDIVVEPAKVEPLDMSSSRSEANLRGHLKNNQEKEAAKNAAKKKNKDGEDSIEDYQLSRALDLIRALSIYKQVLTPKDANNAS